MLRHNSEGLFDRGGALRVIRNPHCHDDLLDHSRGNDAVLLLLDKDALVLDGLHGDAMSDHVFVLHRDDDVIGRAGA